MKVTFIHNPKSGGRSHSDGDGLVKLIERAGHVVTYASSKDKGWEQTLDAPADLVVVAGGDGTVGKVARLLLGRETPFTILPTGTANNIAKTLGLKHAHLADLVAGWTNGQRTRFDVGTATGPWGSRLFIESFGMGLFAEIMARLGDKDSPEREQLDDQEDEVSSVRDILIEKLRRRTASQLTVTLDGQDLSGAYLLLEAMNICYVGPNLHLAPGADPGDGILDLVLVPEADREQMAEYLASGPDGPPPELTVHRGKSLRVEWDRADTHVDDESLPSEAGKVEAFLDPYGLQFLTPDH